MIEDHEPYHQLQDAEGEATLFHQAPANVVEDDAGQVGGHDEDSDWESMATNHR